MAFDYIFVGISIVIFISYLITFFFLFDTRKKLGGGAKTAFTYFILAILFLTLRRVTQISFEIQIVSTIPYFTEYVTLIFAILFSIAAYHFHKAITGVGKKSGKTQESSKPFGIKFLLSGLAILIAVNLLARFNVMQLVGFQSDLLSLITLLFVATEIGVKSYMNREKKKIDIIGWFGIIIVVLLFFTLITGWLGLALPIVSTLKEVIESALLVFVIIEIFR